MNEKTLMIVQNRVKILSGRARKEMRACFSLIFASMKAWAVPLLPFSLLYGAILAVRNWAYDRHWKESTTIGIPVISIGNITAGGTGKTPMAEFLLAKLLAMGHKPAYLSRGYGRETKGFLLVSPATGGAELFGDEAYQVASRFPNVPVAVCEDRVAGAHQLLASHALDVLVLDDAFQHRRIRRDLDWVMVDVGRMPTSDWPLPAGRLRENLRGLRRADTLILSKFKDKAEMNAALGLLRSRFPAQGLAAFALQPTKIHPFSQVQNLPFTDLASLGGRSDVAFSGIGNNQHFEATLRAGGVSIDHCLGFPDHYHYRETDLEKILAVFESQKEIKGKLPPALILTTEKDYFRLKAMPWMQRFSHLPLTYLAVEMVPILGWEEMENKINKIFKES
jgi:tetraacyldisaccharide 4'-kinase